jgi:hypothetical protein
MEVAFASSRGDRRFYRFGGLHRRLFVRRTKAYPLVAVSKPPNLSLRRFPNRLYYFFARRTKKNPGHPAILPIPVQTRNKQKTPINSTIKKYLLYPRTPKNIPLSIFFFVIL